MTQKINLKNNNNFAVSQAAIQRVWNCLICQWIKWRQSMFVWRTVHLRKTKNVYFFLLTAVYIL